MFRNSKKQGDAGLGQAIAYFTMKGYEVALPLTDSADYDLLVDDGTILQRIQVKTSSQLSKNGLERFECSVKGGNKSSSTSKKVQDQRWDAIFLYHLVTHRKALIPKEKITSSNQVNLGKQYSAFVLE